MGNYSGGYGGSGSGLGGGLQKSLGMGTGGQQGPMPQRAPVMQQPYGMGAQGNGNAYGYGGQQGNPWAQGSTSLAPPPAAAPPRYSPNNPFNDGRYRTREGDVWEQQQRDGGMPTPPAPPLAQPAAAAPETMRKALGVNQGTDNGYGYGTPGGYQFETANSTLDPGSMMGLLGILGGSGWQGQAARYANNYRNQYGNQAPGGPRAYPPF